jgi:hypothetical protein
LICLTATLVRLPATYGSSQCRGQHHSPDPSRPACRRLGLQAWNIAEQGGAWPRIDGCARLQLYLEWTYPEATWESDRAI